MMTGITLQTLVFSLIIGLPFGFHQSLSQAITESKGTGKSLILYFRAVDCTTCEPWEAYFNRKEVQELIERSYVAVVVDIDDFDGKACREIYGVQKVPAIVVVDKEGNILYKEEQSLRELAFFQFLQEPKTVIQAKLTTSADPQVLSIDGATGPEKSVPVAGREEYAIQTGYFGTRENAERMKKELEMRGYREIRLLDEEKDGNTFTRVLIGRFEKRHLAESFLQSLGKDGITGKLYF